MPAPLRVAVDATPLLHPRTGVGRFTLELLRGLAGRDDVRPTAFPVSLRGRRALAAAAPPGVHVVAPPLPARLLRGVWGRTDRPAVDALIGRHDLVHGPNFVVPPARAARLATVHDLSPVRFPDHVHPDVLAYPRLVRRAAAAGAWVHAVSHAVRDEAVELLGLDPERVVAVPNGFTPMPAGDAGAGRRRAGAERYVLAVGTIEPRKDLPTLVRAVDALADEEPDLVLVHVGADGWGLDAFERAVGAMRHPRCLRRLGRCEDSDLADVYAGAAVLAYPSVYEGFGFPVLEAMSAGVPVVSTNVPAIEEVAGDAALLVPVGDAEALAGAIARIWRDEALAARLVAAGRGRTAMYSWDACVEGVTQLYRRVIATR